MKRGVSDLARLTSGSRGNARALSRSWRTTSCLLRCSTFLCWNPPGTRALRLSRCRSSHRASPASCRTRIAAARDSPGPLLGLYWCRWGQPQRETRQRQSGHHTRSVGSRSCGLVRTRADALVAPAHLGHEAWPLWALLTACAAGGQILEQRTVCGRYTSAPLLAMVLALGLAVVGEFHVLCGPFRFVPLVPLWP